MIRDEAYIMPKHRTPNIDIDEAIFDAEFVDEQIYQREGSAEECLKHNHVSFRLIAASIILGARIIAAAIKETKQ
jgi:hypothetical protein